MTTDKDFFKNLLKKILLKTRIEVLLGMEFQLLGEENWFEHAKEVTDWIFEKEIPQYIQDKFDLDMEKVENLSKDIIKKPLDTTKHFYMNDEL
jgi:nitrous oxide reductase accessory protein NosL